jgi:hypothetical protein
MLIFRWARSINRINSCNRIRSPKNLSKATSSHICFIFLPVTNACARHWTACSFASRVVEDKGVPVQLQQDILQKLYRELGSGVLKALRQLYSCRQGTQRMNEYLSTIQQASNQANKVAFDYIKIDDNLLAMIMLLGAGEEYDRWLI